MPDRYGVTPLMLACYQGNDSCALFVMMKGASITARSIHNLSIFEAACHGCKDIPGFRTELANAIMDLPDDGLPEEESSTVASKNEARKFLEDQVV